MITARQGVTLAAPNVAMSVGIAAETAEERQKLWIPLGKQQKVRPLLNPIMVLEKPKPRKASSRACGRPSPADFFISFSIL
jgi:peptide deformylase